MWRNSEFASDSVSNLVRWQQKHKMLKEAFGDNAVSLTQTYKWYNHFKKQTDISWQWRAFWMTNMSCDEKCRKSVRGYCGRQKANDSQCLWHCQIVVWNMSANSVTSITSGALRQNLCPGCWTMTKRNTALPSVLSLRKRPKMTPASSPPSLQVMNVRIKDVTLRRSISHFSGRRQLHHDPRKYSKFKTMSN